MTKTFKDYLSGRTVIQDLLDELGEGGFQYNMEYDLKGQFNYAFFAHLASIALTKSFTNTFVMNCT